MVHLGRNPISAKGWEEFKNVFIEEDTATGAGQGNRFFFYHMKMQTGIYLILNGVGMVTLTFVTLFRRCSPYSFIPQCNN